MPVRLGSGTARLSRSGRWEMRVPVGSLRTGERFVTVLTHRTGVVVSRQGNGGTEVDWIYEEVAGKTPRKTIHDDVLVVPFEG